jgi:hypothetical protein
MNRKEKIQLLQDVNAGKVNVDNLRDKDLLIHIGTTGTRFFIDSNEKPSNEFYEMYDKQAAGKQTLFNVNIISHEPQ